MFFGFVVSPAVAGYYREYYAVWVTENIQQSYSQAGDDRGMSDLWADVAREISACLGEAFTPVSRRGVGGGSINEACVLEAAGRRFFVKINDARHEDMFAAEYAGLTALAVPGVIRVPTPVCLGESGQRAFLVMEYISLARSAGRDGMRLLGEQLAALHRCGDQRFGWYRDNTIGSTPQVNTREQDWLRFWGRHRLAPQLALLRRHGHAGELDAPLQRLIESLPAFFPGYHPQPSLLHGDLWSGNYGMDEQGQPVIFDPAVYYGDREADIAMTELFGGFGADFYHAYDAAWPLDPGYSTRKTLYNLYHILNHVNLFGGGYLSQAMNMTRSLLSEIS